MIEVICFIIAFAILALIVKIFGEEEDE